MTRLRFTVLFKHRHSARRFIASPLLFLSLVTATLLNPTHSSAGWQMLQAPIMTDWAQLLNPASPLPEYPRPQMVRSEWMNLNGLWQFQGGATNDPVPFNQKLAREILVPFPMESALSGIMQYHAHSWYRKTFTVPESWSGQRFILHLDAVDWESEVFINGQSLGIHRGGYDPITYDITAQVTGSGPQELIVRVYDPTDARGIPRGKQTLSPGGIMYTSCSGIWQTVWLEPVPDTSVSGLKLIPNIGTQKLHVTTTVSGPTNGITVHAIARIGASQVGSVSGSPGAELLLPVPTPNLWSPENPFLYDLDIILSNGVTQVDSITSYFGMRKISLGTTNGFVKMLLNDQFVFQYGPLDQGFWPDGIYTAPTDEALKSDIEQTKLFGYNMLRKHIKVEPARWYYWADKLGVLVWQDMPSLNSYTGNPKPVETNQFRLELTRMVQNLWNHPSIIMWVVFNEAQGQHDTVSLVEHVAALDPSRLINEASGNDHFGSGHVVDWHSYPNPSCPTSATRAVACGEFGGVGLGITNHTWAPGWGYISATNGSDLAAKFEDFCFQLSDFVQNRGLSAAVYTEITDVEIELNGFLTYDRKVRKPDTDRIRAAIASASTPVTLTTIVPTSQISGQNWKHRFTQPSSSAWNTLGYNDSTASWSIGAGGFGAGNPPNTDDLVRTTWNTSDIWLRRTFNPGNLTSQQISNLFLMVYHDENVEIYINGVLAASATGYRSSYGLMTLTQAGRNAIIPNALNVLAVHCHQTGGGQYIDVGLTVRESDMGVPPLPVPVTPDGLQIAAGTLGVSLGWNTSPQATRYIVKRSLTSGGPYTTLPMEAPVNASTDTGTEPGTTYYYVVSAANSTGESGNSAEISITTPIPDPPTAAAWFKADALTGLGNGAAVANWPDSTGNGNNATQGIPSRRPTYVTGTMNGLPAVRFNGANETAVAFPRPVQDDFTIFCVYRASAGIGTGTAFFQGAGLVSGEMSGFVNDFGLSLNANGRVLAGTGNPDTTIASIDSTFADGQPHLVTFKRTRISGSLELYVDGENQGTATGGTQFLTAPSELTLGAQRVLNNFLTGDIAEVKLFATALSDSDRVAEESALLCKYGLGEAPPAPPSGFSGRTGNRAVFLEWNPVPGASGYKLNWSTNSAGPFTQVLGNLTTNRYTDLGAVVGYTNYYQVAAFSQCGAGSWSSASVFVPLPVLEFSLGGNSLTLSWPDGATELQLQYATNLTSPVIWSTVTNSVNITNGRSTVTLPFKRSVEFFRLISL